MSSLMNRLYDRGVSWLNPCLFALLLLSPSLPVLADDLLMVRTQQSFPEAMLGLQTSIREHGYQITHVQRIDIGLTGMGYNTDKYRVVFVGKKHEIRRLIDRYPMLAAYMPPQISIFAEQGETVMITANPNIYADMIGESADYSDRIIFKRWESDVYSVFEDIRNADE